eukprot:scaffold75141_cov36-Phaeocystis_antarctica.AAC.2
MRRARSARCATPCGRTRETPRRCTPGPPAARPAGSSSAAKSPWRTDARAWEESRGNRQLWPGLRAAPQPPTGP